MPTYANVDPPLMQTYCTMFKGSADMVDSGKRIWNRWPVRLMIEK